MSKMLNKKQNKVKHIFYWIFFNHVPHVLLYWQLLTLWGRQ